MSAIRIVVWDAVGNVMWGVPEWEARAEKQRALMLAEDADGRAHAPGWSELFAGYDCERVHVHSAQELDAVIADADFLITHKVTVSAESLLRGKRLRLVQHLGFDHRGIPVAAARALGVPVAATPLINYFAVAEHCWALMLNHLKQLPAQRERMLARAYVEDWYTHPGLKLACDQTLGLLGFGEIGRALARMARAFDMRVLFWDRARFPEIEAGHGVEFVEWDALFARSDVLSVQLALNDATHGIIGASEFALMKPGALFINTARGKLVDQAALTQAIAQRRICAALDVFDPEPLPLDDPLHALHSVSANNLTLTPHDAWQSHWTHVRDSLGIWENVQRVLRGEPALHLVA